MTTVADILKRKGSEVACMDKKKTVLDATIEMNKRRIGALVILDGDHVAGIISERDILTRIVAAKADPSATRIEQVMTSPIAICLPETTIEECKNVMTEKRIRHLPVVKNHKLMGIITSGDILYQERTKTKETIKYLEEYIQGPYSTS